MPPKKSTLTPVLTLESPMGIVYCVSYFPNGKRIVSGSSDKTTREWNLETGKEIKKARHVCKQKVHTIEISRDGRWVVSAGGDSENGELEIREVATGTVRTSRSQRISCVDISGDSTLLVSGSCDGTVRIWSLETAKLAAGPIKSADSVGAVRFSQNSKKLAVKSFWGKYLEVWDIQSQKLDASTAGGSIYSPDVPVFWTTRDTIVTTLRFARTRNQRNGMIYEFNASTLKTIGAPIKGHTSRPIIGLALSLDCALLVSATSDNTIKLWHFQSRQLLASFKILSVHSIILSPDSRQLVYTARGKSNTIHLCNIPPEILTRIQPIPRVRCSYKPTSR
ncbi:quinon protein alcohol dehydrogenase-like superfamily [Suillus tomentosus]|nr:quinon protein alcohol dehydrogenase-like superfamily [Suillus tomentosus]